jgi:hypothetical protein
MLIARREQLMRIEVTLEREPARSWRLEVAPASSSQQAQQLNRWLRP